MRPSPNQIIDAAVDPDLVVVVVEAVVVVVAVVVAGEVGGVSNPTLKA
ncbi:MAG TPA: hypothetical protein VGB26_10090 [Nitrospiria bacterium]|jgi:hypothetical protein